MSATGPTGREGTSPRPKSGDGKQTAQQVKDTVRETTRNVTSAAKEQARSTYEQKKNVVSDEIGNLASALRQAGSELTSLNQSSVAAQITTRIADRLDGVKAQFAGKDLDEVVREVEDFGRRNPAVFLGVAAALGFLAIRFVKSSSRPQFDDQWTTSGSDISSQSNPLLSYGEEV